MSKCTHYAVSKTSNDVFGLKGRFRESQSVPLRLVLVLVALAICPFRLAQANYDPEELGKGAGAYIEAVSNMKRISESKCAYRVEDEPHLRVYSVDEAVRHIMPHLRYADRTEINEWLSEEKISAIEKTEGLVYGFIERRLDDGLDISTTCDLLFDRAREVLRSARKSWIETLWSYGKSDLWCEALDHYRSGLNGKMGEDNDPNRLLRTFRLDYATGIMEGITGNKDYADSLVLRDSREEFELGIYGAFAVEHEYGTMRVFDLNVNVGWLNGYEISFSYYQSVGGMMTGVCAPIAENECLDAWDCLRLISERE